MARQEVASKNEARSKKYLEVKKECVGLRRREYPYSLSKPLPAGMDFCRWTFEYHKTDEMVYNPHEDGPITKECVDKVRAALPELEWLPPLPKQPKVQESGTIHG